MTAGLFGWDDYPNRLSHYLHLCARSGHGVSKHMFRPMKPSRTGFKEAPYARGSLWTKLCKYLNAMRTPERECIPSGGARFRQPAPDPQNINNEEYFRLSGITVYQGRGFLSLSNGKDMARKRMYGFQ